MHSQRIRQRRRRVALDQTHQEEPCATTSVAVSDRGEPAKSTARSYTQDASRSRQFRTTDLIPKRIWSVTAVIALLLAAIAGLNLLHLNSPRWIDVIGADGVNTLSLDGRQGIGAWYANFLLLLTSCVSFQVFLLRQHRRDDYRGAYRIWLWLAAIFLVASATSVTGLPELCRRLVANTIESTSLGQGLAVVLILKLTGLTLLFIRGLIEVRFSRLAVFGLLLVLGAYGTAAFISEVPEVHALATGVIHSALGNCLLIGCTALFATALSYARYVYLDANGLIRAKPEVDEDSVADEGESTSRLWKLRKRKRVDSDSESESPSDRKQQPVVVSRESSKSNKTARSASARPRAGEQITAAGDSDEKRSEKRRKASRKKARSVESTDASPAATATSKSGKKKSDLVAKGKGNTQSEGDEYLLSIDDDEVESLSKAERRRLRKLKRRGERRAA